MLGLIPGWHQLLGKKSRRGPRRLRVRRSDSRYRRAAFEELEARRLLAINYVSVGSSLDGQLLQMQTRLTTALDSVITGATSKIPLVGNKLGTASQIVTLFNQQLKDGLSDLGTSATPTDAQIQSALSGRLSSFLAGAGASGVHVSHPAGGATRIDMLLQGSASLMNTAINFSTGLPGLP